MSRLITLLAELRGRIGKCRSCGAVEYPKSWMTKTREKAVRDGILIEHRGTCCTARPGYLMLRVDAIGYQEGK